MAADGKIDRQMENEINGQHQAFKIVPILCNVDLFYIFDLDIWIKLYIRNLRQRGTCIKRLFLPPMKPKNENCFSLVSLY